MQLSWSKCFPDGLDDKPHNPNEHNHCWVGMTDAAMHQIWGQLVGECPFKGPSVLQTPSTHFLYTIHFYILKLPCRFLKD